MRVVQEASSRNDFATFLTDDRGVVEYNNEIFSKEKTSKLIKIKVNDEVVYKVYPSKKVLVVLKALYMTFHRDAFWGVAHMAGLDEILADTNTLIRI